MKKLILKIAGCNLFLCFALLNNSIAQSLTDIKNQLIKDWERAKIYTTEYLDAMPADKYSLKATDSTRSFAQQMLHLAQANVYLMSNASDQQATGWLMSNPEKSAAAQQKDSVKYYVQSSYDFCINAVKNSDVNRWSEKKKLFGFEETRFALMNKTFEHQGHHRGQTTIYIRLAGVKPPEEKLF